MKSIDASEDVYDALQKLGRHFHQTPEEVLASLLCVPKGTAVTESIIAFVLSSTMRAMANDADRYLALLGWIATQHDGEFGEFIRSESASSRFLRVGREEIIASCRRNLSCQIDGTQYWAVMNIDTAAKRRFVGRMLEFVGYRDAATELICAAIGLGGKRRRQFVA